MHIIYHEITAAMGGIFFVIIGISNILERRRLSKSGIKADGTFLFPMFLLSGLALLFFAGGLLLNQLS